MLFLAQLISCTVTNHFWITSHFNPILSSSVYIYMLIKKSELTISNEIFKCALHFWHHGFGHGILLYCATLCCVEPPPSPRSTPKGAYRSAPSFGAANTYFNIFFMIAALGNSCKWNVIQQIKNVSPDVNVTEVSCFFTYLFTYFRWNVAHSPVGPARIKYSSTDQLASGWVPNLTNSIRL